MTFSEAAQHQRVTRAVIEGFPLQNWMEVTRSSSQQFVGVTKYFVKLRHEAGYLVQVTFTIDDIDMAQAMEATELFVAHAREQVRIKLHEMARDYFDELTYLWHMTGAGGEQGFQDYMKMSDEEYKKWLEDGEMPESWKL